MAGLTHIGVLGKDFLTTNDCSEKHLKRFKYKATQFHASVSECQRQHVFGFSIRLQIRISVNPSTGYYINIFGSKYQIWTNFQG